MCNSHFQVTWPHEAWDKIFHMPPHPQDHPTSKLVLASSCLHIYPFSYFKVVAAPFTF